MPGLLSNVDPDGLLEYSVVYTDRSLNHMSQAFQGVWLERPMGSRLPADSADEGLAVTRCSRGGPEDPEPRHPRRSHHSRCSSG